MRGYDPQACGANCAACPLRVAREGAPVGPELIPGTQVVGVGEAPGREEVLVGQPFVGDSGQILNRVLTSIGRPRGTLSLTNVLSCRPPGNDLTLFLDRVRRENKKRAAVGQDLLPSPIDCCRPRLAFDMRGFDNVLLLGKRAYQAVVGGNRSITEMRGAVVEGHMVPTGHVQVWPAPNARPIRIAPVLHPAHVLRYMRWLKVFTYDLAKAFRWFDGKLQWKEAKVSYQPDAEELRAFLYSGAPYYAYDVETERADALITGLRCIGFATPEEAMLVGLQSIDGQTRFYGSEEEEAILEMLRGWYTDRAILKVGHNAGMFDRLVIEHHLGVTPAPLLDTILLHRNIDSELPHNLGFVGSVHTDVPNAWKADHTATEARSDSELHTYCVQDCVVNARIVPPLVQAVQLRQCGALVEMDHKIQDFCAGLHVNGMFVDLAVRDEQSRTLRTKAAEFRLQCRHAVGDLNFNPSSVEQVKEVLFRRWALSTDFKTDAGEPSTGDDAIRALMIRSDLTPKQASFLKGLRGFRKYSKLNGTYVTRLRRWDEEILPDDLAIDAETEEGQEALDEFVPELLHHELTDEDPRKRTARKAREKAKGKGRTGYILADGRIHPSYNCHTPTSGRLSSSGPNAQNWPSMLRRVICPETGRVFVEADQDQLELRAVAALSGAARYLEIFDRAARGDKNADPHVTTSEMIFGDTYRNGSTKDKKVLRAFSKRFTYAVAYGATVETVHDTLAAAENDAGELVFPDLSIREVRQRYDKWLSANPEIERWWEAVLEEYRRQKYLVEPVLGRRRDFADGEDRNEIINFKPQSLGSGVVHLATLKFLEYCPFAKWGPGTGLIQQGHDALVAEVPRENAAEAAHVLRDCMRVRVPGLEVTFTAKPKIGRWWGEENEELTKLAA